MSDDLKSLEKEVRRAKRIATEWASQLHDLVEDRLPDGFEELPRISQSTYAACREWKAACERLATAQAGAESSLGEGALS